MAILWVLGNVELTLKDTGGIPLQAFCSALRWAGRWAQRPRPQAARQRAQPLGQACSPARASRCTQHPCHTQHNIMACMHAEASMHAVSSLEHGRERRIVGHHLPIHLHGGAKHRAQILYSDSRL